MLRGMNPERVTGPLIGEGTDEQGSSGLRSLDLVQRLIASALATVVLGSIVAGLAAFVLLSGPELSHARAVGLWIMIGLVGLINAAAVLVLNRRRPWSPWVLLGLVPMALVALRIFT